MDNRIRRNEICIVGLPRCDFVFSSARSCFIAYGFEQNGLEISILKGILEKRDILPEEAGESIDPAQYTFCKKICSKIISAQFCVILLNNDVKNDTEMPNANVNMEYGLMLGFNKFVVPFQRADQALPFNVAGLDTVKYTSDNFERLAEKAIDKAIEETKQDYQKVPESTKNIETFLLTKQALFTSLNTEGDQNIYDLGKDLGFLLLNDFKGMTYMYFGVFTSFRREDIIWRIRILEKILVERSPTIKFFAKVKLSKEEDQEIIDVLSKIIESLEIWVLVTSNEDKEFILRTIESDKMTHALKIFSNADITEEIEKLSL